MEGFGSDQRPPYGVDRRMEIVSGKISSVGGGGANQIYATRFSDAPPVPARPSWSSQGATATKPGGFSDPETKRKRRIAQYKVYTVEGQVKASLRKGLRWIKNKCSQIVRGY